MAKQDAEDLKRYGQFQIKDRDDLDSDDLFSVEPAPVNPFGDDSAEYQSTKPVNLAQLIDEIEGATGEDVSVATFQADLDAPISEDNPMTLFVWPKKLNQKAVKKAVEGHEAVPKGHLSDEERASLALVDKVKKGEPISEEERDKLLFLLVKRL